MKSSYERIVHMLMKEFIQIFRDPRMRGIIFFVPLLQALIFGYAVTTDVKNIKLAVFDEDLTDESRRYKEAFFQTGYFVAAERVDDRHQMLYMLDSGDAMAALHIPKGFGEEIAKGKSSPVQAMIDGTDSNTATIIQNYLERISGLQSRQIYLKQHNEKINAIDLKSRAWFNQNLESKNYYVPGVVATLLTLVTLTLTSMSIVREREMGTMEQIIVTPITSIEFILGKLTPFILMGFFNVVAILSVAVFWFEVPIQGSMTLLLLCAFLYLLNTLGIGLFISTISHTQQQAMMGAFIFYFPIILLSGFIFPIANMPEVIQWLTYFNPLRYFLIIIRGIFLKGIGIEILWPQIVMLGMMGLSILWLSTRRFHKKLS